MTAIVCRAMGLVLFRQILMQEMLLVTIPDCDPLYASLYFIQWRCLTGLVHLLSQLTTS